MHSKLKTLLALAYLILIDRIRSRVNDIIFTLDTNVLKPFKIFQITVDLRHLSHYSIRNITNRFAYGREWQLLLQFYGSDGKNIEIKLDETYPEPSGFYLNSDTPFQFFFMPYKQGKLEIVVDRDNDSFHSMGLTFRNCVTYKQINQSNTTNSTPSVFVSLIPRQEYILYPSNLFNYFENQASEYFIISSAANLDIFLNSTSEEPMSNNEISSRLFQKETTDYTALPYLPYFTDCGNLGKYIFLNEIIDNPQYCNLTSPEDIEMINEFNFGKIVETNSCLAKFQCKHNKNFVANSKDDTKIWFNANVNTVLFQLYPELVTYEYFKERLVTGYEQTQYFVDVTVESQQIENKIPTSILLEIGYYQKDSYTKKIVSGTVKYSGFVTPTSSTITYELTIVFRPLTHTELTVAFALSWYLYLIIFIGIGLLALTIVAIWYVYHWIFAGHKEYGFHFLYFIKANLKPVMPGVALSATILLLYFVLSGFIFLQKFMNFNITWGECAKDENCNAQSVWDYFVIDEMNDMDINNLRNARFGVALVHAAFFVIVQTIPSLIPKSKNDPIENKSQGFDRNIMDMNYWRRANYLYVMVLYLIFELYRINFSFTKMFADNPWTFIGIYKVLSLILERIFKSHLLDELQLMVLVCGFTMSEALCTSGASDLLDYLQGNIIGLGISMAERLYLTPIIEVISDKIEEKIETLRAFFRSLFGENDKNSPDYNVKAKQKKDPAIKGQAETVPKYSLDKDKNNNKKKEENDGDLRNSDLKEQRNPMNKEKDDEESVSQNESLDNSDAEDILLTDEGFADRVVEKYMKKIKDIKKAPNIFDFDSKAPYNHIDRTVKFQEFNLPNNLDMKEGARIARDQETIAKENELADKFAKAIEFEEEVRVFLNAASDEKNKGKNKKNEDKFEVEMEKAVNKLSMYATEIVGLWISPFLFWLIWAFYSEIQAASGWGIKERDLVYYLIFAAVFIPFQVIIDMLFFNLEFYYHGVNLHTAFKQWEENFKKRMEFWIADQPDKLSVEQPNRALYKYCHNWQKYFLVSITSSALIIGVLGIISITNSGINVLKDPFIAVIIIINYIIVKSIMVLLSFVYKIYLRMWPFKSTAKTAEIEQKSANKFAALSNELGKQKVLENAKRMSIEEQPNAKDLEEHMKLSRPPNEIEPFIGNNNEVPSESDSRLLIKEKQKVSRINFLLLRRYDMAMNLDKANEALKTKRAHANILKKLEDKEFKDEKYQFAFISKNSEALKYRINEILTDDAVARFKKEINKSLQEIFGDIEPGKLTQNKTVVQNTDNEAQIEQKEMDKKAKDEYEKYKAKFSSQPPPISQAEVIPTDSQQDLFSVFSKNYNNFVQGKNADPASKPPIRQRPNDPFKHLLVYWLKQSRIIFKARSQVARLLEKMTNIRCDFCGANWGLRCETINNFRQLFEDFIQKYKCTEDNYSVRYWQKYFEENVSVRTLCHACNEKIQRLECIED